MNTRWAVPAEMALLISFESVDVSPRSAMSLIPSVATDPSRQNAT